MERLGSKEMKAKGGKILRIDESHNACIMSWLLHGSG